MINDILYNNIVSNFKLPVEVLGKLAPCSAVVKATFLDLCTLYWRHAGMKSEILNTTFINRWDEIDELIALGIVELSREKIEIPFLDECLHEAWERIHYHMDQSEREVTPDPRAISELMNIGTPEETKKIDVYGGQ